MPPPLAPPPLFSPYRALGYITDSTPFAVQRRGKETYVTVSVGKTWQVGAAAGVCVCACERACGRSACVPASVCACVRPHLAHCCPAHHVGCPVLACKPCMRAASSRVSRASGRMERRRRRLCARVFA